MAFLRRSGVLLLGLLFGSSLAMDARADGGVCLWPFPAPAVRTAGGLTVRSPARPTAPPPALRLRTHVSPRDHEWFGPEVPGFVPLESHGRLLDLLDGVEGVYVALYREPFETCGVGAGNRNCGAEVRVFDCFGRELTSVLLTQLMSRPDRLEVQDVRWREGVLYFNEACQSYAREAGGRCSSLVAVDPFAKRVLWRTPSLVSNNWFTVMGDYVVAAYGFTGEPASIRLVRRSDGAVVDRQPLEGTNFEMTTNGDLVTVNLYYDRPAASFRVSTSPKPALVRVPAGTLPKPPAPQASLGLPGLPLPLPALTLPW